MKAIVPPIAISSRVNMMKKVLLAATEVEYADFLEFLDLQMDVSAHRSRI